MLFVNVLVMLPLDFVVGEDDAAFVAFEMTAVSPCGFKIVKKFRDPFPMTRLILVKSFHVFLFLKFVLEKQSARQTRLQL